MSLHAFGSNGSGQLGLGHRDDVWSPSRCVLPEDAAPDALLRVAAGGNHTLILFRSGAVYATGENGNGRCGQFDLDSSTNFRRMCLKTSKSTTTDEFLLCAATWEASLLVTRDHEVYIFGSGSKGELGLGRDVTEAHLPRQILGFPPQGTTIIDLVSCVTHVVAVLSDGQVFGWGNGRKGQLGEPAEVVSVPRKISGLDFKVVGATCGREFTYFISSLEDCQHAVLGSDKWSIKSSAPSAPPIWSVIGSTWGSIFVRTAAGDLLSWGRNDHGQLAFSGLPTLRTFVAGSEHVLAVTDDGKIIAWGWGEHGNCGKEVDEVGDVNGGSNDIGVNASEVGRSSSVNAIGAGCATSWLWTKHT